MKKIDLLKLVESMEDEAEVIDILKEHEEIKSLAKDFDVNSITLENFKNMLANNKEIKGYYQSTLDSGIGKGVSAFEKNFTENKLPKIIEDEKKKAEGLTEEQIKLNEALAEVDKMKKENAKEKAINRYSKLLIDKGLNGELVNYLPIDAEDSEIEKAISNIEKIITDAVAKVKEKEILTDPPLPSKGNGSKEKMSLTEAMAYVNTHPDVDIKTLI